jgi:hypothetical protein
MVCQNNVWIVHWIWGNILFSDNDPSGPLAMVGWASRFCVKVFMEQKSHFGFYEWISLWA